MQAITTNYNGYRFRSRLEARWAVVFDHLGLKYRYEPEGFHLKRLRDQRHVFYLPDFLILEEGKPRLWVEVKPYTPEIEAIETLQQLCMQSRIEGLIVIGDPSAHSPLFWFTEDRNSHWVFRPTLRVDCFFSVLFTVRNFAESLCEGQWGGDHDAEQAERTYDKYCRLVDDAFRAGTEARFEFGETPIP